MALWARLLPSEYPNGVVVFCSESMAEAVHPLQPLHRRVYSCGRHFDTAILRDQLQAERADLYGIVVIDGSDASIGTAQGLGVVGRSTVTSLAHLSSTIASRTRRGGQSANRYARNRDAEELAFVRRVAEQVGELLGEVRGIALAGKGDLKRRLLGELSPKLREQVLCVTDLPCGGEEGLRLAAQRATEVARRDGDREAEAALSRFMELVALPGDAAGSMCCYGNPQTLAALQIGAVDVLLMPADGCDRTCSSITADKWKALCEPWGTLNVEIQDRSELGMRFCASYGVGGCLRWPVDFELLEEAEVESVTPAATPNETCVAPETMTVAPLAPRCPEGDPSLGVLPEADCSSTCDRLQSYQIQGGHGECRRANQELLSWLERALDEALQDSSVALSLAACAEVLLADETASWDESVAQAAELLLAEGAPQDVVDELVSRAK